MKSLTMAWRNVWRNSRRTLAAVGATTSQKSRKTCIRILNDSISQAGNFCD